MPVRLQIKLYGVKQCPAICLFDLSVILFLILAAQDLVRGNYTLAGWLRKRGRLNTLPGARKVFPCKLRHKTKHLLRFFHLYIEK